MALATQCPHCRTTFRVAQDQLKLRTGLVRCGACKEVFNGIENLLRPEQPTPIKTNFLTSTKNLLSPAGVSRNTSSDTAFPHNESTDNKHDTNIPLSIGTETTGTISVTHDREELADFSEFLKPARITDTPSNDLFIEPLASSITAAHTDPLRPTALMDCIDRDNKQVASEHVGHVTNDSNMHAVEESPAIEAENGLPQPDTPDMAIEEPQRNPHRHFWNQFTFADENESSSEKMDETEEPDFVKHGRRKETANHAVTLAMGLGSFFLFVGLVFQGAYAFRSQIAAWFPHTRPILEQGCLMLGCRVDLPAQIDAISLESSELQMSMDNKNVFVLAVSLRNHSHIAQVWPNIELMLNDSSERPILRRVFTPREYLSTSQISGKTFVSDSEQSIKLTFEITQLKPIGYRVYLFYP